MRALLAMSLLMGAGAAWADEPAKDEKLPPPRVVESGNLFLTPLPPAYYTHGTREVWNNYAVDRYGRWRPRVILSPYGSYYYSTGRPYPWLSNNPGSMRPVTHD